ncbi:MAG TPA: CheR family methyltransferase, partial [Ilumatobacteraceae bacterium]
MPTDPQILDAAAAMLDARIGLHPDPSFRPRLARALLDVAADRAIELPRLASTLGADASLLDDLTDRVTVQETAFFRHKEHFDALRDLLASIGRDTVRVWSTACANGQEPYSIAMVLAELGCDGAVLATDVSPAAVTRAAAARYADREMAGVSDGRRRRHFEAIDGEWQVRPHVRDLVRVRRHNMLDVVPPEVGACQVVFCRNVLIYLTPAHARSFLARLADAMGPDALLFIGGAETLWHVTDRFEAVAAGGCFVYRRKRS